MILAGDQLQAVESVIRNGHGSDEQMQNVLDTIEYKILCSMQEIWSMNFRERPGDVARLLNDAHWMAIRASTIKSIFDMYRREATPPIFLRGDLFNGAVQQQRLRAWHPLGVDELEQGPPEWSVPYDPEDIPF